MYRKTFRLVLPLLITIYFTTDAGAEGVMKISILSILKPTELRLTLESPGKGVIVRNTKDGQTRNVLLSGTTLDIRASGNDLVLSPKAHVPLTKVDRLEIQCAAECRFRMEIPGQIQRNYIGNIELKNINNTIIIVLQSNREQLTEWISVSEMAEHREMEALRAFAIVARSYLTAGRRHPDLGADFCDTTHCQVFQGPRSVPEMKDAVESTAGLVLMYRREFFRPFYSRLCGGKTATYETVWNQISSGYPFYSVICPCRSESEKWVAQINQNELTRLSGMERAVLRREKDQVVISNGTTMIRLSAEDFRTRMGRLYGWNRLPANQFTVVEKGSVFELHGAGIGHGVGFCQTGAVLLARNRMSYSDILRTYFPNTEVRSTPLP